MDVKLEALYYHVVITASGSVFTALNQSYDEFRKEYALPYLRVVLLRELRDLRNLGS